MKYRTTIGTHPKKVFRVAVVYATDYAQLSIGGIKTYIESIGKNIPENIHITYIGVQSKDLTVEHPEGNFVGMRIKNPSKNLNLKFLISMLKAKTKDFDLIICHRAEMALFLRLFKRARVFLILHGGTLNAWHGSNKLFGAVYPIIEIISVMSSVKCFSVNPQSNFTPFKSFRKIHQAPIILDQEIFNMEGVSKHRKNVFLVGRLEPEKRFNLAIHLVDELSRVHQRDFELEIIGDGSQREHLEKLSSHLDVKTIFHGRQDAHYIANLFKVGARYLLITSKFEGFPIVALEALACGVKVFALNAPGVGENLSSLGCRVFSSYEDLLLELSNDISRNEYVQKVNTELENLVGESVTVFWREVKEAITIN